MTTVRRYDATTLGKATRTPQGFLRAPAFLTRAGIFTYRRGDGTLVRELRPPEEVFKAGSLATLASAPITDLHPSESVSPTNVRGVSVGHVGESVRQDDDKVAAELVIQHADTIAAVERGDRRELSCGYQCRIDETPGEWNGQPYDCVQRDVVYNHVAIGPRGWGRAGAEVALRLDSGDAVISTVVVAAPQTPQQQPAKGKQDMDLVTIRIDNNDVQVPRSAAAMIEQGVRTLAQKRVELLEKVKPLLPHGFRCDDLSDHQLRLTVISKLDTSEDFGKRDEAYVAARFDTELARIRKDSKSGSLAAARVALSPFAPLPSALRNDANPAPYTPDWQRATSMHKGADGKIKNG